jgi:hypothetical protein
LTTNHIQLIEERGRLEWQRLAGYGCRFREPVSRSTETTLADAVAGLSVPFSCDLSFALAAVRDSASPHILLK